MKTQLVMALLFSTFSIGALAQNVTVNVPDGYKIELIEEKDAGKGLGN